MIENDVYKMPDQLRGTTRWYRGMKATVMSVDDGFALLLYGDGSSASVPVGSLLSEPQPPVPRYRVGNHQAQNIYLGGKYIGVMFDPAMAARVVDALNAADRAVAAERWNT